MRIERFVPHLRKQWRGWVRNFFRLPPIRFDYYTDDTKKLSLNGRLSSETLALTLSIKNI